MGYIHLTIEEMAAISFLRIQGASIRAIARAIGRNPSTVKRELDRNFTPQPRGDEELLPPFLAEEVRGADIQGP